MATLTYSRCSWILRCMLLRCIFAWDMEGFQDMVIGHTTHESTCAGIFALRVIIIIQYTADV